VKTGAQGFYKCLKKPDSGPEQESGTGWSLPANVFGGFIRQFLWRIYPPVFVADLTCT